jgi:type II secretory pathway pseudopilin PulG
MRLRGTAVTLVEVVIVILLLSILAMVTVPRFTKATDKARESALTTDLQAIRRQVELYKAQHGGRGPHLDEKGKLDAKNIPARLTGRSRPDGTLDPAGPRGPYLCEWPANPYSPDDVARDIRVGTDALPPRDGTTGWYYNTHTARVSANSRIGGESLDSIP